MPSLTAFITGNIEGLKNSFTIAKSLADQTGSAMKQSLTKSLGNMGKPIFDLGDTHGGKSGVIRETLVLMREVGRGNWSRVPGSLSILMGQLGVIPLLLSPIVLGAVAIAAAFGGILYISKKVEENWTGLKLPDFKPEYIAKHLQAVNQVAESQKEINKEIEKSIALYSGAAKAAEEVEKNTKDAFEHQRKINQYSEQSEMNHAASDKAKQRAIRQKYSDLELELNQNERDAQIKNKRDAEAALKKEMQDKKAQADELGRTLPSKERDENDLKKRKADAEAAQKIFDDLTKEKEEERRVEEEVGGKTQHLPGYRQTRDQKIADAKAVIEASHNFEDVAASNEEKRKKKGELLKEAEAAAAAMVKAGSEGDNMAKDKARRMEEETEEAQAKLDAENSKHRKVGKAPDVNALQKIGGAYASAYDTTMMDVSKKSEGHLKEIKGHLAKLAGSSNETARRAGGRVHF